MQNKVKRGGGGRSDCRDICYFLSLFHVLEGDENEFIIDGLDMEDTSLDLDQIFLSTSPSFGYFIIFISTSTRHSLK